MKINLIDKSEKLCKEWCRAFHDDILSGNVKVICATQNEYFDTKASALVSPANSFGIMDGGIDKAIISRYGQFIQNLIQEKISRCCFGENPVGNALTIGGNDIELSPCPFKWIISAPTMRQPEDISETYNAYLAMRAILVVMKHEHISSVNICGLGTGVGNMSSSVCANQMKKAYEQIINWDGKFPEYKNLWKQHKELKKDIMLPDGATTYTSKWEKEGGGFFMGSNCAEQK